MVQSNSNSSTIFSSCERNGPYFKILASDPSNQSEIPLDVPSWSVSLHGHYGCCKLSPLIFKPLSQISFSFSSWHLHRKTGVNSLNFPFCLPTFLCLIIVFSLILKSHTYNDKDNNSNYNNNLLSSPYSKDST